MINIDITRPDGTHDLYARPTDAEGKIDPVQIVASQRGEYLINASFVGDVEYLGSTDSADFIAETVPSAPLNLTAVAGDGEVTLTWEPPLDDGGSPILYYNLYRTDELGNTVLVATVNGTVVTLADGTVMGK